MKLFIRFASLSVLLASFAAPAVPLKVGDDFTLNLGVLLQPRMTLTANGSADGSLDTDFFLRRVEFAASGTAYKSFLFYVMFAHYNFNRRGAAPNSTSLPEMTIGWTPLEDQVIEAGYMKVPGSRTGLYASGAGQVGIESSTGDLVSAYQNGTSTFRETGAQIRGFLGPGRLVHYRLGLWEGLHSTAATATAPAVNPGGKPLLGGSVRVNLVGEETVTSYSQMYLDGKARASLGGSIQYQAHAACVQSAAACSFASGSGATGTVNDYLAYTGDAFVDWPLSGDMQVSADASVQRSDYGNSGNFAATGTGYGGTLSFRLGKVAVFGTGYKYTADAGTPDKSLDRKKLGAGLAYFISGHNSKVTAEFNSITPGPANAPGTFAPTADASRGIAGPAMQALWIQGQAWF